MISFQRKGKLTPELIILFWGSGRVREVMGQLAEVGEPRSGASSSRLPPDLERKGRELVLLGSSAPLRAGRGGACCCLEAGLARTRRAAVSSAHLVGPVSEPRERPARAPGAPGPARARAGAWWARRASGEGSQLRDPRSELALLLCCLGKE